MTNLNNAHKFSAAAVFGAAALFSMLSFGSNAEAASVFSCKGATASVVTSCCEKVVEERGRPLWMTQAKMNCHDAVSCMVGKCRVRMLYSERLAGNEKNPGRSRGK